MAKVPKRGRPEVYLGELDDRRSRFGREATAWTIYLHVAANLHPPVISSLLTDRALAITARYIDEHWLGTEKRAQTDMERLISEWCRLWGFKEYFARIPAHNTMVDALDAQRAGRPLPTDFPCDVHGRRYDGTGLANQMAETEVIDSRTGERSVPGRGPKLTVDLPNFYWEPTAETLSDALKRITDAIRPIVRTELETIRESYLADHYEPVVRKRDRDRHFE